MNKAVVWGIRGTIIFLVLMGLHQVYLYNQSSSELLHEGIDKPDI